MSELEKKALSDDELATVTGGDDEVHYPSCYNPGTNSSIRLGTVVEVCMPCPFHKTCDDSAYTADRD